MSVPFEMSRGEADAQFDSLFDRPLPIGEDVARAYIDGRNEGRTSERARIRQGLWEAFDRLTVYMEWPEHGNGRPVAEPYVTRADLNDLLNEICPVPESAP